MHKHFAKIRRSLLLAFAFLVTIGLIIPNHPASAIDFCVTPKCKAAKQAEAEATKKAQDSLGAAHSLEQTVARLNAEISVLEAKIHTNQVNLEYLKTQIQAKELKLNEQRSILANLLVDIHFEHQTNPLMLLASSNSLSDLTEKQARADSIKSQINLSAQSIKEIKTKLEHQKTAVDQLIDQQKSQQNRITENRNYQNQLISRYRYNASAFAAEAEAARKIKEKEIAEEIARYNNGGVVGFGVDSYPYRNNCPQDNLRYVDHYTNHGQIVGRWGLVCQCTSYAGWKAYERWRVGIFYWGDAKSWAHRARAIGYRVDRNPAPGTIAVSTDGPFGHVMWVESVNANGTINLSEYNNTYSAASHLPGDFGFRKNVPTYGLQFIHFN